MVWLCKKKFLPCIARTPKDDTELDFWAGTRETLKTSSMISIRTTDSDLSSSWNCFPLTHPPVVCGNGVPKPTEPLVPGTKCNQNDNRAQRFLRTPAHPEM